MEDEIQNPCRNCQINLNQDFLRKLDKTLGIWFPCPNNDCHHVHAMVGGGLDQFPREVAVPTGKRLGSD